MTTGERIKEVRKAKGLTQKKLGELSGTSEGTVRQYEIGKRQPRIEQLQAIAAVLDVDIETLLSNEPKRPTGPTIADNLRVAGFSLAALSEKTKIPKEKLHQLAKGKRVLITPEEQKELSAALNSNNILDALFTGDGLNISAIAADVRRRFSLDIQAAISITDYVVDLCTGYFRTEPEEAVARLLWLLNDDGKAEAIKRVSELTEIPKYQE